MKKAAKKLLLLASSFFCADKSPKTVFYHDVSTRFTTMGTTSGLFWQHMEYLREGDNLCFDDGFRGIWDEREKFVAKNIRPIVFIAVGLVGCDGYLTWDEILHLQDDFGFVFQSHTWSHQTLAGPYNEHSQIPVNGRTDKWFKHELVDSKSELEQRLGKEVDALCFPLGYFSESILDRCRASGYKKVYCSYPGNADKSFVQPRCLVQHMSVRDFRLVLNGGMNCMKRRYLRQHYFQGEKG